MLPLQNVWILSLNAKSGRYLTKSASGAFTAPMEIMGKAAPNFRLASKPQLFCSNHFFFWNTRGVFFCAPLRPLNNWRHTEHFIVMNFVVMDFHTYKQLPPSTNATDCIWPFNWPSCKGVYTHVHEHMETLHDKHLNVSKCSRHVRIWGQCLESKRSINRSIFWSIFDNLPALTGGSTTDDHLQTRQTIECSMQKCCFSLGNLMNF